MSELKLQKLIQLNQRLKEELDMPRIPVSEAALALRKYTESTTDPLVKGGGDNPFLKKPSVGCSLI
ncbi:G-protein gamma subunit [Rozella allomycis CSF55]|uniref:G-protein gamma subunit n=1 Tax=Rozella allomycis (strain CSF55) TaxID=988480 RepID=A0A075AXK4_ROZAC|nr:hypothetical protein O9G_001625 [Rozella allomycis CSF55]RKP21612.1 G-protein gamma subunit [Rozella allomycis CSF55]|eukprot:EPZ33274.1 hypothetical protein O9G_001625 [Rozella allomycis CSF55]